MKRIQFQGKQYFVLDESPTHYICEPASNNEGYHYITKNKAIEVTQHNYPIGDVTQIKAEQLPKIDLLIGGSPCQGFSIAGKKNRRSV